MKPDISLIFPSSPFLLNQAVFPPLGIMYLSSFLKQYGFDVQCLDLSLPKHTKEMAESDIVGISFTTPQRDEAFELVRYYRSLGKKVIAGGPHPSHMGTECYEAGFTHVIKGNGETQLLNELLGVKDISLKINIDSFPFPDRDSLPMRDYQYEISGEPATVIMTSRGCPYRCSFCAKVSNQFEMQSAERTVNEIEHINKAYGFKAFMVFDDIFIANKKRIWDIIQILEHRDLKFKFRCFARSNLINDDICKLMKRLGIVEVGIGIESGSNTILKKNLKNTTREMNSKAILLLRKYGIRAKSFLIVGLPGENEFTVGETESWIREARPDDVDISVFQPLPGSLIFNEPEKFGIHFEYNGNPSWYKGTPGKYKASASTDYLSEERIVQLRDWLENTYKDRNLLR